MISNNLLSMIYGFPNLQSISCPISKAIGTILISQFKFAVDVCFSILHYGSQVLVPRPIFQWAIKYGYQTLQDLKLGISS